MRKSNTRVAYLVESFAHVAVVSVPSPLLACPLRPFSPLPTGPRPIRFYGCFKMCRISGSSLQKILKLWGSVAHSVRSLLAKFGVKRIIKSRLKSGKRIAPRTQAAQSRPADRKSPSTVAIVFVAARRTPWIDEVNSGQTTSSLSPAPAYQLN